MADHQVDGRAAGAGIQLATLGPVRLAGPDAEACARVLAQPKRLALLAYLAVRPAGEGVSRDRILATFWPERPAGRAQGNLRAALHFLRRQLGGELIVGRGSTVRIAPRFFRCDATRLLAGREGEPPDVLLGLYRGDFLDGLYVREAPDFEHWVDRRRAALRARATELAWSLASSSEASGQWISATRYARRAADLAVDVEGATQRLIQLLVRAGDAAAAMAEYERLAARLEEEFGIAPSPETTALIAPLRSRPARLDSVAPAKRAQGGTALARSLAVLPFEDLSDGSAAYLASGLLEDLLTALAGLRGVRVVSRTSVRRFAAQPPTSLAGVREVLGVDLVLEGSVQQHGDRCRITVQLIDVRQDRHVWAESYDRDLTDVFAVQRDIALRVTRALAVEVSPREHHRLRRAPTTSLRAWRLYLRGREVWGGRTAHDAARAALLFQQALELDDRFAAAWAGLADARLVAAVHGGLPLAEATRDAKENIQRALECDPASGEAHATLGLILTFFEWDHRAAGVEYRRAIELSPGYAMAHAWYGNWLCVFEEPEQGLAELATALDLDPLSALVTDSLGLALLHLGRFPEAEEKFRQALALDPEFWRARFDLAVCCASRGDLHGAARELVRVWVAGGWGADPADAAEAARRAGDDPRGALEHLLQSARSQKEDGTIRMSQVVLLMMLGRHEEALAVLDAGRHERWLGSLFMYAPVLDPLARRASFRRLMDDAALLIPRWH